MSYYNWLRGCAAASLVALLSVAGCGDSGPTNPGGGDTVHGGPDNRARDGSYTEAISAENGIAVLEPVMLGGVEQWLLIRGHDVDNPLLIFLHGGPGSPAIPYSRFSFKGLERHFTVVTWDQRGCGKSYGAGVDASTITVERLLADTESLIRMIRARFGVQRVFLMGLSWGSYLGVLTVRDHPELVHAYIGVGQVVDVARAVPIAHAAALERAADLGRQDAIDELSTLQIDPIDWDQVGTLQHWLEELGLGDIHDPSLLAGFAAEVLPLTEYTDEDQANEDAWLALYGRSPLQTDQTWLRTMNLVAQVPRLEVPVVFLGGRYDFKTPTALVEEYVAALEAPAGKDFFRFDNSAHVPFIEERDEFHRIMIESVRPLAD